MKYTQEQVREALMRLSMCARKEHKQCFCDTNMEMVLQCFDDAVKDWRRTFCDVENCNRR